MHAHMYMCVHVWGSAQARSQESLRAEIQYTKEDTEELFKGDVSFEYCFADS